MSEEFNQEVIAIVINRGTSRQSKAFSSSQFSPVTLYEKWRKFPWRSRASPDCRLWQGSQRPHLGLRCLQNVVNWRPTSWCFPSMESPPRSGWWRCQIHWRSLLPIRGRLPSWRRRTGEVAKTITTTMRPTVWVTARSSNAAGVVE